MSIELRSEISMPQRYVSAPLPIKRVTFTSRNAGFAVETSEHDWVDRAVHFYVGPIGLHVNPDEAEALGKALIECAEHFRASYASKGDQA